MDYDGWGWKPYVPVAERLRRAQREMEKRRKTEKFPTVADLRAQVETRTWRLGSGKLFRPGDQMGRFEGDGDGPDRSPGSFTWIACRHGRRAPRPARRPLPATLTARGVAR